MFDDDDTGSATFSITALVAVIAAGVLTFCAPQPAHALTLDDCPVHATFAYALRAPEVTPEALQTWVLLQHPDNHQYFQSISELTVENLEVVRSMTPQQFGDAVFQMCEQAVKEGTI